MINKSFSKGDMLDIIRQFNLDIPNSNNMDKLKLSITLWSYVNNLKDIEPDRDIYLIENKEELLKYLSEHNPDKLLSVKEKGKLMNFCKEVIVYCNNGYNIEYSSFNTIEEIHIPTSDIAIHGDIPSVRRAIRLLNEDPKLKEKIEPIISNKMKKQIELKKNKKSKYYYGLITKKGNYVVTFD
tara:strand:- start:554 stop:1102 length:549 start_codon:yes stop_codon:yes gene_type:complete